MRFPCRTKRSIIVSEKTRKFSFLCRYTHTQDEGFNATVKAAAMVSAYCIRKESNKSLRPTHIK